MMHFLKNITIAMTLVLALTSPASAQSIVDEIRVGVLAQGCCGQGTDKEGGVGVNAEVYFSSPRFLSILAAPRPVIGGTVATASGATSQIYAGLEWRANVSSKFFVAAGFGGAIHNAETDDFDPVADAARVDTTLFLGCPAHFRLAGDVGYRLTETISAAVSWAHISNAGLCAENEGLDHLGVKLGYAF